jgi:hypothetical protein
VSRETRLRFDHAAQDLPEAKKAKDEARPKKRVEPMDPKNERGVLWQSGPHRMPDD